MVTITSGDKEIYKSESLVDRLLKQADPIPPRQYVSGESFKTDLSRCANRRYADESFEDYKIRRKEQAAEIKKRMRGILVWDSASARKSKSNPVPGQGTYIKPKEE